MKKLNMGCGFDIRKDYVNADSLKLKGVDKVIDFNKLPYPFKDKEFDEILVKHVIEHLSLDTDLIMKELHRILKDGGKLIIEVPHYTSRTTYYTQHKKVFSSLSFICYISTNLYNRVYDFAFSSMKIKLIFQGGLHRYYNFIVKYIANKNIMFYEETPLRMFPAKSIEFTLTK